MDKVADFVKDLVQGEIDQGEIDRFVSCLKNGLFDHELSELEAIANQQISFMHPLKRATQIEQNNIGHHNLAVLKLLKRLKTAEKAGQVLQELKAKCSKP